MDSIESLDEEYAFREQINEAIAASTHQPDEFLMALRFQEMLEDHFCYANNEWKDAEDHGFSDEPGIDSKLEIQQRYTLEEWRGVFEEYTKLSTVIHSLNLNGDGRVYEELECDTGADEEEWDDAVEDFSSTERESGEEEEFSEAMSCGIESEEGFFSLYFKGVSAIKQGPRSTSSGIGVVLRKPNGEILLELQKKLDFCVDGTVAEQLGLIDGLLAALERGLTRVKAFTDSQAVYDQIARGRSLDNQLLIAVRQRVLEHVRQLDDFVLTVVESEDMRSAMWLAREAICPTSYGGAVVPLAEECQNSLVRGYTETEDDVLFHGVAQNRQWRYGNKVLPGHFHVTTWAEASEFSKPYPCTGALGMHSWREREKGIGEWKFL